MAKTGPYLADVDVVEPDPDPQFEGWLNRQQEARNVVQFIVAAVLDHRDEGYDGIVPRHSSWRIVANDYKYLNRVPGYIEWQVHDIFLASKGPSLEDLPSKGDWDYSVPHASCFLTTIHELKNNVITVGEINAVMWLAITRASKHQYKQHHIFPVTVVCVSHHTLRITQGVCDVRKLSFELRMTEVHDYSKGFRPKWEDLETIVGWLIGRPVGDTL